jgi:hypothetical protein
MSSDLEVQLRAEMEQFTAPVRLSRGLAVRAYRRQRRRRITTWTAAAAGTAAVASAVAMITAGAAPATRVLGHTTGPQAPTAAYVAHRVEVALDAAVAADDILYIHATDNSFNDWSYDVGQGFTMRYQNDFGQLVEGEDIVTPGKSMGITVNYATKTWYRQESRLRLARGTFKPPSPTTSSCRQIVPFYIGPGYMAETPTQLEAGIREALGCGQLLRAGTEQVDGVSTIKLVPSRAVLKAKASGMTAFPSTLWVSSSSYLPVRWESDGPPPGPPSVCDISWLPPTAANLARLTVTAPPGFQRVAGPPKPGAKK